jgi:Mg2+-importing ATPase
LVVAMALPFSPLAPWFGFQRLPIIMTGSIGLVAIAYLVAAEMLKQAAIRSGHQRLAPHRTAVPA